MKTPSAREVVGRRIVAFDLHPFNDGRGRMAHAPEITLDDGSRLHFVVEETDVGEYGVRIIRTKKG